VIQNCTISHNASPHGSGGGIYCNGGSDGLIANNVISANTSGTAGGGIYVDGSSPQITHAVTHLGKLTGTLGVGLMGEARVEVTPDSTVAVGATKELVIRLRSVGSATKQDVIKVITTKG